MMNMISMMNMIKTEPREKAIHLRGTGTSAINKHKA